MISLYSKDIETKELHGIILHLGVSDKRFQQKHNKFLFFGILFIVINAFETCHDALSGDGTHVSHVQITPMNPFKPSLVAGILPIARICHTVRVRNAFDNMHCKLS
jgi:hypothetical protein